MYKFRLYVVGRTPRSVELIEESVKLLEYAFNGRYHLDVIEVIESPELADKNEIMATPALEKVSPEPVRKVIGDLSDKQSVLSALGLTAQQEEEIK